MQLSRLSAAAAALVFIAACGETPTETEASADAFVPQMSNAAGGVVHKVSAGGPDICRLEPGTGPVSNPGCNGNFSLVAMQNADGSVSGQWEDSFGHGDGGVHIAVDCLTVQGNAAIVGGVVTHAVGFDASPVGWRAFTAVVDNGESENDPPDQISYSHIGATFPGEPGNCEVDFQFFYNNRLFDLPQGQVTVK